MKSPRYFRITDYDRSLLPNKVLRRLEKDVAGESDWIDKTGLSPGHPAWGIVYHVLLASLHPAGENNIIETGTNWGSSTIVLAQAIRDAGRGGKVYTIEIDPKNHAKAKRRVARAGLEDLVEFHLGASEEVLPALAPTLPSIRFAYLDGGHELDTVMAEFAAVEPKLTPGALVIMDNTFPITEAGEPARVSEALKEIVRLYGGAVVNLPFVSWYTPGLAMWQKDGLNVFENLGV